jgi:hypothetical protein
MPVPLERPTLASRVLVSYYLATPLFALLDFRGGVDLRAAFLHDYPAVRLVFYAGLFALGLLASQRARLAPVIALLESGANIGLLVISIFAAYVNAVSGLAETGNLHNPFTPATIANICLSAVVLILSYPVARGARGVREVLFGS